MQRLRLLSIVQAGEQPWAAAASEVAGAADEGSALLPSGPLWQPQPAAMAEPAEQAAAVCEATASAADGCHAAAAASQPSPQPPGGWRPMLWGELYASEPRRGLAALLPRRRLDTAERLIRRVGVPGWATLLPGLVKGSACRGDGRGLPVPVVPHAQR